MNDDGDNILRRRSVDSCAPSILLPLVWVSSTPSTLFVLYLSLHCEKNENKQTEAEFGPFQKQYFELQHFQDGNL